MPLTVVPEARPASLGSVYFSAKLLILLTIVSAGAAPAQELRKGFWRGQEVTYTVVNGAPVTEGDILLENVEESRSKDDTRDAISRNGSRFLWPNGTVPYVIDDGLPNQSRVTSAIEHWNSRTGLRLVPRTTQTAYIRFRQQADTCSSFVGMIGREQAINLDNNCGTGAVIHEIGHAIGLYHEQSRIDREFHMRFLWENVDKRELAQFQQHLSDGVDRGGYDYGSIMHYDSLAFSRNLLPVIETIPAGIPVSQREALSSGDIDAVSRMYGLPVDGITISTFPAGLDIEVDGQRLKAPQTFQWAAGSTHTIGIPDVQHVNNYRFLPGRWSDNGDRVHTITVNADTRVYTAHMVRQIQVPLTVNPPGTGRLDIFPSSPDGWYPDGTVLEVTAVPNRGYNFVRWSGFGYFSQHGTSPNPLRFAIDNEIRYTAQFSTGPVTTITSDPPGLDLKVDGLSITTPRGYVWEPGSSHNIEVDETSQTSNAETARHTFDGWTNGGGQSQTIVATSSPQTVTAKFRSRYNVTRVNGGGGQIDISPSSQDGFYDADQTLQVSAFTSGGFRFQGWTGDLYGSTTPFQLRLDDQKVIGADFVSRGQFASDSAVNGASYLALGGVAPGEIISILGYDIGPVSAAGLQLVNGRASTSLSNTQVWFDEFPAPLVYVSGGQINAVVPYGIAGRRSVTMSVQRGSARSESRTLPIVAAAPGLFTDDSSGRGQLAAINEDGTRNGPNNPARRGSTVVVYATGGGATVPAGIDGAVNTAPFTRPELPVRVRIAGIDAIVDYAGAAPGFIAGAMQINLRIPEQAPTGVVPVSLAVGNYASVQNVSISIQ